MQARITREPDVRLSVRLSVSPSVKRVNCKKTKETSAVQFLYHIKEHLSYSFPTRRLIGGGRPLCT